jgi:6-phosphogluconolactonase
MRRIGTLALILPVALALTPACGDDEVGSSSAGAGGGTTSSSAATESAPSATSGGGDGTGAGGDGDGGDPSTPSSASSGGDGGDGGGAGGAAPIEGTHLVLVGTGEGTIERWQLDRATGTMTSLGADDVGGNPSFLAPTSDGRFVYGVNENGGQVMAFAVDPDGGPLVELGTRRSSEGGGPAHVSVDRSDRWVLVANYGGGTVAVLPIEEDGSLGDAVDVESPGENAHQIRTDPSNQYAFVPCLGSDHVAAYFFNEETGQLAHHGNAPLPDGAGPRHLEFHPTLPRVYVINELGDSLTAFDLDAGLLLDPVTISTLPDGQNGDDNACADLHVHPSGDFIFGSNRGFDTIATFALDASGAASPPVQTSIDGEWPRNFALEPEGDTLLVANQRTDEVVTFRVDPSTGALTQLATTVTGSGPAWVGVVVQAPR